MQLLHQRGPAATAAAHRPTAAAAATPLRPLPLLPAAAHRRQAPFAASAAAAAAGCSRRRVPCPLAPPARRQRAAVVAAAAAADADADAGAGGDAAAAAPSPPPACDAGSALDADAACAWLRQYPAFSNVSAGALRPLCEAIRVEVAPAGKTLGREGVPPDALVVVRQGSVRVSGGALRAATAQTLESSDGGGAGAAGNNGGGVSAGPGAAFYLVELLLNKPSAVTLRAATDATLWVVPGAALRELAAARPDLALELGLNMGEAAAARRAESSQQADERRQRALQPYLVTTPKRGVVGSSRYAERLRKQIVAAARDPTRRPVLVFGEPGLAKDNIAALLQFGGPNRNRPVVQVDALTMDPFMTELFGRGEREGLLSWVRDGALIINNVHKAAPHMLPALRRLLEDGTFQPAPGPVPLGSLDLPPAERLCLARVILTAEQRVPALEGLATVVKVPPLRVRPADVLDLTSYYLRLLGKAAGVRLTLTPEAERTLLAHAFPGNITELEGMIERAAAQAAGSAEKAKAGGGVGAGMGVGAAAGAGGGGAGAGAKDGKTAAAAAAVMAAMTPSAAVAAAAAMPSAGAGGAVELDKDVFWFAANSRRDVFKWNALSSFPLLRDFLRSDVFPEGIMAYVVKPVFAAVVLLLFVCPQDRGHNFCLSLFWNYWWPLMFVIYPFLGRIWCSVCPFMVYGEVMQRWRVAQGVLLRKWPREQLEQWGGWFLFGLFAAILVWEEVWDLPQTAYLSSWLLLLITGGAVVCSAFFERRLWCRYLCPIGGMNGLFAKLAMTELRARQGVCSGTCSTYTCYKGGPAVPPEGMATDGCPLYSHPAQLTDNRNCVLCMTCLKACPHRSVEFRLRLPGVDLWSPGHKAAWSEVSLMFMLLGAVYLHNGAELEAQFGLPPGLAFSSKGPHILWSVAVMAVPGAVALASDVSMRLAARLGLLPGPVGAGGLALAAGGAGAGAGSAPTAAAATAAAAAAATVEEPTPFLQLSYGYLPLVWGATLSYYLKPLLEEAGRILPVTAATFGASGDGLPVFVGDHAVTEFLQGSTLALGAALSLLLTRKLGARPWLALAPQCLTILGFTAELWYLIVR